jgi:hypothetical protein
VPVLLPVAAACAAALAIRLVLWGGRRPFAQALAELIAFGLVYALAAWWRERPLLAELLGALRDSRAEPGVPGPGDIEAPLTGAA